MMDITCGHIFIVPYKTYPIAHPLLENLKKSAVYAIFEYFVEDEI